MSTATTECRVYERHSCEVPTSCKPAAAGEMKWDGVIADVSRSGLRLRLRRRFEPRAGLAIELPGRDGEETDTVYVKVVHVRNDGDGYYSLGCRLVSELSDEELDRLLNLNRPAEAEDDEAPEILLVDEPQRTVVPEVQLWVAAGRGRSVRCRVKRLHVGGAWPFAAGQALHLRGVAADGSRLEHTFRVVHCREHEGAWAVHVEPADPTAAPAWLRR